MNELCRRYQNQRMVVGMACSPGECPYMQDRFLVEFNAGIANFTQDIVGVCDGHGPFGEQIAEYICRNISKVIGTTIRQDGVESSIPIPSVETAFLLLDEKLYKKDFLLGQQFFSVGTTCNIVIIGKEMIYCCNIGDSRAIMSVQGKAVSISVDHKPSAVAESSRIAAVGGFVMQDRVNGELGVARAFGDFRFKMNSEYVQKFQLVTCLPDVCVIKRRNVIDFIVVASDGVWDIMTNQEVVDYIKTGLKSGMALEKVCMELVRNLYIRSRLQLRPVGADNATIVVAKLVK